MGSSERDTIGGFNPMIEKQRPEIIQIKEHCIDSAD